MGTTGLDGRLGVMAARGLTTNPALFAGFSRCPWGAVERFIDYVMKYNIPFRLTQHHVSEMLEGMITKKERAKMNDATTNITELIDWLDERFVLRRRGEQGFGESVAIRIKAL
jgi:tRNA-dihydrouridine synthase 4